MRRIALAGVLLTLGLPGPAVAASSTVTGLSASTGTGSSITTRTIPVRLTGSVSVRFSPDAATGCAALAACAYSGEIDATPSSSGQILVVQTGRRTSADFLLGGPESSVGGLEYALVQRAPAGRCADEQEIGLGDVTLRRTAGTFAVSLPLLGTPTRCAGPLPADLERLLPRISAPAARLLRGHMTLDFRITRRFRAHGFAGTLVSTVVATLGRPGRTRTLSSSGLLAGVPTERDRVLSEPLTLTGTSGSITVGYAGTTDQDVCVLLDSCGLAGTLTVTPAPAATTLILTAQGPATRPMRDFRAALGLGGPGRVRGIVTLGAVRLPDGGEVQAQTTQAAPCRDTVELGPSGMIAGRFEPGRIELGFLLGLAGGTGPHTSCPGPVGLAESTGVVGSIPTGTAPTFTVTARAGGEFEDDGYTGTISGMLRLHFRRGPLRTRIEVVAQ